MKVSSVKMRENISSLNLLTHLSYRWMLRYASYSATRKINNEIQIQQKTMLCCSKQSNKDISELWARIQNKFDFTVTATIDLRVHVPLEI